MLNKNLSVNKGSSTNESNSGFALIELFIVMLIITVMVLTSLALYKRNSRRLALQGEAVGMAMRLEKAKTLAKTHNTQYRIRFDEEKNNYISEVHDRDSSSWIVADSISSSPIALSSGITYGFPSSSESPAYGPAVTSISAATPELSTIQFNSRGFPVVPDTPQPLSIRAENAIYLTDGRDSFAVTVTVLGRLRIWAHNGDQWAMISH
jgi:Tfp pilus assembly protein FimT